MKGGPRLGTSSRGERPAGEPESGGRRRRWRLKRVMRKAF